MATLSPSSALERNLNGKQESSTLKKQPFPVCFFKLSLPPFSTQPKKTPLNKTREEAAQSYNFLFLFMPREVCGGHKIQLQTLSPEIVGGLDGGVWADKGFFWGGGVLWD